MPYYTSHVALFSPSYSPSPFSYLHAQSKPKKSLVPILRYEDDWEAVMLYGATIRISCEWNIPDLEEGRLVYAMYLW